MLIQAKSIAGCLSIASVALTGVGNCDSVALTSSEMILDLLGV
jgi:hypothetical protein